uniref:MFS-type transporter pydD n=1 Tax=Acremonium sp. TaxID=2046025 RepID=PYDD_ACRSP|nr:RecName: Full=MFS-type transporter pydD; AltName: Full=Pyrrocidines biosynthesis cluster protein D [Acremonium sp.]QXF14603.1 PydD [Acremonium sp.]
MLQEDKSSETMHDPSTRGVETRNVTAVDSPLETATTSESPETERTNVAPAKRDWRFWALLVSISLAGLLTALEGTITSTALPSIVNDLGGGHLYVWVVNGYLFAMTAMQPMYGQLANIFGRRWPMLGATALFVLGSGICGGATNIETLIAGRILQGIGASGTTVLTETIICDVVPLRERSKFLAIVMGMIFLGTALGPFFAGLIVQYSTWRWTFYLALPVGGAALVALFSFLKVKYQKETNLATKISTIDWAGNALFVAAISSVLIGLSWAGSVYAWSSFRVLVPLFVGIAGMGLFMVFEGSRFAPNPTVPLHLFGNRTSVGVMIMTFFHGIITIWQLYFMPVYFQGVLGSSPSRSGVQILATILAILPAAGIGGFLMTKMGRYKPIHYASWAVTLIGLGLFSLLDSGSSTGAWVGFQIVYSMGAGMLVPTLLPALLAPLSESDTALGAATWSFVRSFGMVWGTAIPAAVFNTRSDQLAPELINSPALRADIMGGKAYEHATSAFLGTLSDAASEQMKNVFSRSLRQTWLVSLAFAGMGLLAATLAREVPMRSELDTEYGMEERKPKKASEA